jgi:uncharacterized protein (TIGR02996 family)
MSDEAAFLAALKATPGDDTTRLVYADWLDERSEHAKAQYLRAVADLVSLPGGSAEYTEAAERLYCAGVKIDDTWRATAGARFDVVLEGYGAGDKVPTIKLIRERTGFGLAEAKALAESWLPTALFSWLPFERALPHLLAFHPSGSPGAPTSIRATIRPTVWPDGVVPGAVFDIHLCAAGIEVDTLPNIHIHVGLARLLGISLVQLRHRLRNPPIVMASGLQPAAVADFVRRLKLSWDVLQAMPADAIRIVPRLPTV